MRFAKALDRRDAREVKSAPLAVRELAPGGGRALEVVVAAEEDAGDLPVRVGEIATLLGEADGQSLTLTEVSEASGVQPRGLTTALGRRLPRLYE